MMQRLVMRGRMLLAPIAGAVAAFGQAPYELPLLLFAGLVAAFWLYRARSGGPFRAALLGWGFGFGYFLHALQWIVSPFLVDVARHGWMAPFALILLAAGMALFWGLAFGLPAGLRHGAGWPWRWLGRRWNCCAPIFSPVSHGPCPRRRWSA